MSAVGNKILREQNPHIADFARLIKMEEYIKSIVPSKKKAKYSYEAGIIVGAIYQMLVISKPFVKKDEVELPAKFVEFIKESVRHLMTEYGWKKEDFADLFEDAGK